MTGTTLAPASIGIYCAAMRGLAAVAAFATLVIPVVAQQYEPIIDMHMHALAADAQGPPPLAMCTPFVADSVWNPASVGNR
jgi:hypothetical protein